MAATSFPPSTPLGGLALNPYPLIGGPECLYLVSPAHLPTESPICSVVCLIIGEQDVVALCRLITLVESFHVEILEVDMHRLVLRPMEDVFTVEIPRIQPRVVYTPHFSAALDRGVEYETAGLILVDFGLHRSHVPVGVKGVFQMETRLRGS